MQLEELMDIVLRLVDRIWKTLETELATDKDKDNLNGRQFLTLVNKEGKEPEDQGRIIQDIDDDPLVSLVRESMKMKEKSTDFVTPYKAYKRGLKKKLSVYNIGGSQKHSSKVDFSKELLIRLKEHLRKGRSWIWKGYKIAAQMDEEVAKQIHIDKMLAKRVQEEQEFKIEKTWNYARTESSKKQKIDIEDASIIKGKDEVVKEEEAEVPVKKTGMRRKQKARKGISIDKNAQGDSESDKEESVEAMNPTPLAIKSNIVLIRTIFQHRGGVFFQRSIYQINESNGADTLHGFGAMIERDSQERIL
ncbi:hypothetical protein Tco_1541968 [Tanacetum coccineum]